MKLEAPLHVERVTENKLNACIFLMKASRGPTNGLYVFQKIKCSCKGGFYSRTQFIDIGIWMRQMNQIWLIFSILSLLFYIFYSLLFQGAVSVNLTQVEILYHDLSCIVVFCQNDLNNWIFLKVNSSEWWRIVSNFWRNISQFQAIPLDKVEILYHLSCIVCCQNDLNE